MKIVSRLSAGFGIVVVLALCMAVFSALMLKSVYQEWQTYKTVTLVKAQAARTGHIALGDVVHDFKNYVLRGADYAQRFDDDLKVIEQAALTYRNAGLLTAAEDSELRAIATGIVNYRAAMAEAVRMRGAKLEVSEIDRTVKGADKPLSVAFDALEHTVVDATEKQSTHITEMFSSALLGISVAAAIVAVIAALFAVFIGRSITRPLSSVRGVANQLAQGDLRVRIALDSKDEIGDLARTFNQMADSLQELVTKVQRSGVQVASSATEIAASVKEQQASATEQAATTVQIVASSKEIASTAKVLVKSMDEVAHGADATSTLAEGGHDDLARMEATMKQMMEATHGIAARLAVLSEKAGNISSVVSTINKVADQTNLLSLNAAIEAEKAGEHGVGFGVVATEIRRLADQTAIATWDIEQMVKEVQSAVSSGVMGMEKFSEEVRHAVNQVGQVSERLSKIVKSIQQLTPHFESVYEAMQAQSVGADQINQAIEQVSQAVQGTAQAMRESASVVDQLNEASQRLQAGVARFKTAG